MATNIKVIQARDFIRAAPDGHADLVKAERLLQQVAEAGSGLAEFDVIVDTRRVSGALTATELWILADKLVHYRNTFARKTAILCPLEKFDHSAFFALCGENRGFNIRAFISYEDAMEWLLSDEK